MILKMNWMYRFRCILFVYTCIYLLLVNALNIKLKHGYTSNEPSFITIWKVSLHQCLSECQKYSQICTGIGYNRYTHLCFLYKSTGLDATLTRQRQFVYIDSLPWQQTDACVDHVCSSNEVCESRPGSNTSYPVCVTSFCEEPIPLPYGRLLGLGNAIGVKRLFKCDVTSLDGPSDVSIECLESGDWSSVSLVCLPFGDIHMNTFLSPHNAIPNVVQYSDITRDECVRRCYSDTELCAAVNYYYGNGTCILTANQIKLYGIVVDSIELLGWELIHKIFPVFIARDAELNWYGMTHSEAVHRCISLSTKMASESDVRLAYDMGYSICSCGFVRDYSYPAIVFMNFVVVGCSQQVGMSECTWNGSFDAFCINQDFINA